MLTDKHCMVLLSHGVPPHCWCLRYIHVSPYIHLVGACTVVFMQGIFGNSLDFLNNLPFVTRITSINIMKCKNTSRHELVSSIHVLVDLIRFISIFDWHNCSQDCDFFNHKL